ncbi:DUF1707 domain-containing protein [Solihabitans fulvus]|uniref:DUF1707 domain-containing protein n=1 Tax=Solihabitans fulvus TaxID=1892852 RepID=A0A5B2XS05_9PSEU|nr:DUF1707 domain-containing protein [Solihabitans fulvus]KAA2265722.1 DUF1707 domain-containing protein [Solihabitans fulvus]
MSADQGDTQIRASDSDRERIVTRLRAAVGEGFLTLDEADERITAAYAARYRGDLTPLTADLPAPVPPPRDPRPFAPPRLLVPLAVLAAVFVTLSLVSPVHHFFWPIIPLTFLALRVFGHRHHHRPNAGATR